MSDPKPALDYMSRPEELAKQPAARVMCEQISMWRTDPKEQRQVFDALWSFWNFAHAWDDLIDGSNWSLEQKELGWKALAKFVENLLLNPFLFNNAVGVEALLTSAVARSVDAEAMAARVPPVNPELLRAVRCADLDVLVHFARLAGGWECMRSIGRLRDYDVADVPPKGEE